MCCGSTAKEHQFCLEKSGGLTELMRPQCPKFVCKEVSIILSIVVKWSGTESEKSLKFEKKMTWDLNYLLTGCLVSPKSKSARQDFIFK